MFKTPLYYKYISHSYDRLLLMIGQVEQVEKCPFYVKNDKFSIREMTERCSKN